MGYTVSRALAQQLATVDPQRLIAWIQKYGWQPHPTAQPRTLTAWANPQGTMVLSLPIRPDDQWFAVSAAALVDAVCTGHDITLLEALQHLGY